MANPKAFNSAISKIHRSMDLDVAAVMIERRGDQAFPSVVLSLHGPDNKGLEVAAEALLHCVATTIAETPGTCPACLAQLERVREALAILRQRPIAPTAH